MQRNTEVVLFTKPSNFDQSPESQSWNMKKRGLWTDDKNPVSHIEAGFCIFSIHTKPLRVFHLAIEDNEARQNAA